MNPSRSRMRLLARAVALAFLTAPAVQGQDYNITFGPPGSTTPDAAVPTGYAGAASKFGVWNLVSSAGTTPLVNVFGTTTGTTISLNSGTFLSGTFTGPPACGPNTPIGRPGTEELYTHHQTFSTNVTWTISGLTNGVLYDIWVYSWNPAFDNSPPVNSDRTRISVNNGPSEFVGGCYTDPLFADHNRPRTYSRVIANPVNGAITVAGVATPGSTEGILAGIQIRERDLVAGWSFCDANNGFMHAQGTSSSVIGSVSTFVNDLLLVVDVLPPVMGPQSQLGVMLATLTPNAGVSIGNGTLCTGGGLRMDGYVLTKPAGAPPYTEFCVDINGNLAPLIANGITVYFQPLFRNGPSSFSSTNGLAITFGP